MKKLLVITPTRERVSRLKEMMDSFFATKSEGTHLFVYVALDDKQLDGYGELIAQYPEVIYEVGKRRTLVEVDNYGVEKYPEFEFYGTVNDDHIFITPQWDAKLMAHIKDYGISGANDVHSGFVRRVMSNQIISANLVKAQGYFVHPMFRHYYSDDSMRDIAEALGRYYHDSEVVIEHRHWSFGKSEIDDTYKVNAFSQNYVESEREYDMWTKIKDKEIERIKRALNANS